MGREVLLRLDVFPLTDAAQNFSNTIDLEELMASFNKIIIVGYLGRDPELQYTPQGTAVCKFTVATTERRKDKSGEQVEATTWFRVSVWGKQAEVVNNYLSKGRQVFVEGRLRQEEYTDRDGNKRTSLEVNSTDVQFIGARGDDAPQARTASREPEASAAIQDDDIPF
jgi:single-strand DNA-binding protein